MKLKNYDYKADIWSLGVVLYELLYATHPFTARNQFELVKVIENNEVQFLDYPVLTDQCKQFISILLHKNPTKRASFHDIIDHVWLNNWNTFNILTSSSTYELYNEFIVQDRSKDINTVSTDSMSNNSMTSLLSSSNEEIFKFDDEDNFKSIDLSDHGDYVMVEDNVKTIAMTYSLHDLYQKFIDNYF